MFPTAHTLRIVTDMLVAILKVCSDEELEKEGGAASLSDVDGRKESELSPRLRSHIIGDLLVKQRRKRKREGRSLRTRLWRWEGCRGCSAFLGLWSCSKSDRVSKGLIGAEDPAGRRVRVLWN